jgi:hypothetical protein
MTRMRDAIGRTGARAALPAVLAVGFVSVVCGTVLAHLVGVGDTPGPDWTEWGIQALALGVGMALLAFRRRVSRAAAHGRRITRRAGRPHR